MAFFQAQHINMQSGGAVIAPWDLLDGLDLETWSEAAMMLGDVAAIRKRKQAERAVFEKARKAHPNYSRYH